MLCKCGFPEEEDVDIINTIDTWGALAEEETFNAIHVRHPLLPSPLSNRSSQSVLPSSAPLTATSDFFLHHLILIPTNTNMNQWGWRGKPSKKKEGEGIHCENGELNLIYGHGA